MLAFVKPRINEPFLLVGEFPIIEPLLVVKLSQTQANLVPFLWRELGQFFQDLSFAHDYRLLRAGRGGKHLLRIDNGVIGASSPRP